jgi:hypothetical protein
MKENFDVRVLNYLKDKFPNHTESDYEEATMYLCYMLIIERDRQFKEYMSQSSRGRHR